jgi:hypothetical protein
MNTEDPAGWQNKYRRYRWLEHADDKKHTRRQKNNYRKCGAVKDGDDKEHKNTEWLKKNEYRRCG